MIRIDGERLRVTGPMLIASATELKSAGVAALTEPVDLIDLSEVTEADSSAVAVLLAWVRASQEKGRTFSIINSPESIRSLAALYGVAELLPLV
jgi:phospholipid transport system transporter-binding protein